MLRHGSLYGCYLWLPEDKKGNIWHGREKYCGLWPPAFLRSPDKLSKDGLGGEIEKENTFFYLVYELFKTNFKNNYLNNVTNVQIDYKRFT